MELILGKYLAEILGAEQIMLLRDTWVEDKEYYYFYLS